MAVMGRPKLTPEQQIASKERRREMLRKSNARFHENNKELILQRKAENYLKHTYAHRQYLYRLKAIVPKWANLNYIKLFYIMAAEDTKNGLSVEVDHMVPINHPLVCGLHVEYNLQVATKKYNQKKKNMYWPDMPTYSYKDYEELYENHV